MISLTSDYAVMPENDMAESKEERGSELVLAKIADRLVVSSSASFLVLMLVFEVSAVITGLWLRSLYVPSGLWVATAWVNLWGLVMVSILISERAGNKEPQWVRAAAVHKSSVWARLPEDTRAMLQALTDSMMSGARWREAHVFIARCTSDEQAHYGACCAGGTLVMNGRLLVVLGEHLAVGPVATAHAVLAHERRHTGGWQLYGRAVSGVAGSLGLIVVAWSVTPWPLMLLTVIGIRMVVTATSWVTEISCDIAGARETSPAAMLASLEFKRRTTGGARALYPRGKRWTMTALRCLEWPVHPSHSMRRTAIETLAGKKAAVQ